MLLITDATAVDAVPRWIDAEPVTRSSTAVLLKVRHGGSRRRQGAPVDRPSTDDTSALEGVDCMTERTAASQ